MTAPTRKPKVFGPVFGVLIGLPLLLIAAVLSIPYAIVARIYIAARERRLFRRLCSHDRTLPWSEVEQHLRDGTGTLIVEQAQKQGLRLWWTPDDVAAETPFPPPPFDELNLFFADPQQPFVAWCFERYLSPSTGTASLTRPIGLRFPAGFVPPDFFTAQFPSSRVVATTLATKLPNDRNA